MDKYASAMWAGFADELSEINGWDKEAGLLSLFGKEAPQVERAVVKALPKKPFVPSFQGHAKAIEKAVGKRLTVDPRGIEQASHWNPMTQSIHRQHAVTGVEGWT